MLTIFLHINFRFETENAFGCQRFGFPLQFPSLLVSSKTIQLKTHISHKSFWKPDNVFFHYYQFEKSGRTEYHNNYPVNSRKSKLFVTRQCTPCESARETRTKHIISEWREIIMTFYHAEKNWYDWNYELPVVIMDGFNMNCLSANQLPKRAKSKISEHLQLSIIFELRSWDFFRNTLYTPVLGGRLAADGGTVQTPAGQCVLGKS